MFNSRLFSHIGPESPVCKLYHEYNAFIKVSAFILYYLFGTTVYCSVEDWSVFDSVYFLTVSATSVGYGDHSKASQSVRLFTAIYDIIGVTMVMTLSNEFANAVLLSFQDEVINLVHKWRGLQALSPQEVRKSRIYLSSATIIMTVVIGTTFYSSNEDWTVIDGFYWTIQTMTTIGYGICNTKSIMASSDNFNLFFFFNLRRFGCEVSIDSGFCNIFHIFQRGNICSDIQQYY